MATVGFVTIHPSTASKFLTVPNADQAGSNPVPFSQFVSNYYGMTFQEEREILALIVNQENRNAIMEMINKQHGLKTEAGAIICSLGVDQITKVG